MKVAVYGSLRKGLGNHQCYLKNETCVGTFETKPEYTMYSLGGFPGLVKGGHTSILMEVYDVNMDKMKELDILEGYSGKDNPSNHYNRTMIDTPYGKAVTYLYNYNTAGITKVTSGDWVEFTKMQQIKTV